MELATTVSEFTAPNGTVLELKNETVGTTAKVLVVHSSLDAEIEGAKRVTLNETDFLYILVDSNANALAALDSPNQRVAWHEIEALLVEVRPREEVYRAVAELSTLYCSGLAVQAGHLADVRRKLDALNKCLLPVTKSDKKEAEYVDRRIFKNNGLPKIGVAFSGGGTRASCASREFVLLLQNELVTGEDYSYLDVLSHISALSGSTWFWAQFLLRSGDPGFDMFEDFGDVRHDSMGGHPKLFFPAQYSEAMANKFYQTGGAVFNWINSWFGINPGEPKIVYSNQYFMEAYTTMLGKLYFGQEWVEDRSVVKFSFSCGDLIVGENNVSRFPFPIMTAMGSEVLSTRLFYDNEEWIEFTPFAVQACRGRATRQAIKMSHFGGELRDGRLPGGADGDVVADEIGQLMALWGSAFTISTKGALSYLVNPLNKFIGLDENKWNISSISSDPTSPVFVTPYYKWAWEKEKTQMRFRDPGLRCNLPLQPLLVARREIERIILIDASEDTREHPGEALVGAIEWHIQRELQQGHFRDFQDFQYMDILKFYKSPERTLAEKYTPRLWSVGTTAKLTHILYIPIVNNARYNAADQFDDQGKNAQFWNTYEFAANVELKNQLKADVQAQFEYLRRRGILKTFFESSDATELTSKIVSV